MPDRMPIGHDIDLLCRAATVVITSQFGLTSRDVAATHGSENGP